MADIDLNVPLKRIRGHCKLFCKDEFQTGEVNVDIRNNLQEGARPT